MQARSCKLGQLLAALDIYEQTARVRPPMTPEAYVRGATARVEIEELRTRVPRLSSRCSALRRRPARK